jgi:endonuclease/exonuclease/phosphatase family metal-dependent hydrolase
MLLGVLAGVGVGQVREGAEPVGSVAGGVAVSVMSFNLRFDNPDDGANAWPERWGLVAAFLREREPDLVGVQEALKRQLDDLAASNPEFGRVGVGRSDGREGGEYSAILYRRARFVVLESGTFWLSDTPDVPGSATWGNEITRISTWARFRDVGSGATFYHFNTHFDHQSQPSRERSAALLAERVAARTHRADPVIVTGDFNAGESNPAVRNLLEGLTDTFRAAHPDAEVQGTFHGFSGNLGEDRIDYVLVTDGVATRAAEVLRPRPGGRFVSDHEPVSATVVLPARE